MVDYSLMSALCDVATADCGFAVVVVVVVCLNDWHFQEDVKLYMRLARGGSPPGLTWRGQVIVGEGWVEAAFLSYLTSYFG
jgi:hypothetical protein